MMVFSPTVYGCPEPGSYSWQRASAVKRDVRVKGRARFTLDDFYPVHTASIVIPMNEGQFYGWQSFWADGIRYGADWFLMPFALDGSNSISMLTHATGPFSASIAPDDMWSVSMSVEAAIPP